MWTKNTARKVVLFLLYLCLGISCFAVAEEKSSPGGKATKKSSDSNLADPFSLTSGHEPIHIRSRTLEFFYQEKRIVYHDEVVAVQGDTTLKSDLLTVFYEDAPPTTGAAPTTGVTPTTGAAPTADITPTKTNTIGESNQETAAKSEGGTPTTAKQRIKEIIAEGNVDITTADRRATSKKAVFDEAQRTVVLTGDAHVQELGNWVSGERVTVYLDEKRSVVEGGGGDRRAEMEIVQQQETEKKGTEKKGAKKP
jgi:lipopolysaccharide export system protein LptA